MEYGVLSDKMNDEPVMVISVNGCINGQIKNVDGDYQDESTRQVKSSVRLNFDS